MIIDSPSKQGHGTKSSKAIALNQLNLNVLMTAGQIIQMVGGVGIIALSTKCDTFDQTGFALASVMYTSYLLLFSQLFWDKYEQRIRSWCGCAKEKDE